MPPQPVLGTPSAVAAPQQSLPHLCEAADSLAAAFGLQALHSNDTKAAVRCLRQDLQPLKVKTERLHELAQAVMCQDGEELCSRLKWPGPHSGREQLLQSLQVGVHQRAGATMVLQGRFRAVQTSDGRLPAI